MIRLLYVSSTDRELDAESVASILASSRKNNVALNVTGLLLHIDGGFMQVLEGEKHVVEKLYSRIAADRRHWDTQVLLTRNAPLCSKIGAWDSKNLLPSGTAPQPLGSQRLQLKEGFGLKRHPN